MFNNLRELIVSMPTEQACKEYLFKMRWADGKIICPYCGHGKSYIIENGNRYKCASKECYKRFTITVGTIFEASNIPLNKWLPAIYLTIAHKKGISSYQLGKDIGVTQKSAWFMLHRIREMMKDMDTTQLQGIVEIDETYLSRKYGAKYQALPPDEVERLSQLPPVKKNTKGAVIGMIQRDGKAVIKAMDRITKQNIIDAVKEHIAPDAMLMTDESNLYKNKAIRKYQRQYVCHSKGMWVDGDCHVNTVENFWSVMKRGVYGIYHQISYKHLQAYCSEYSYRYNHRKIKDADRFVLALQDVERRLSYKRLVHGKGKENTTQNNQTITPTE